MNNKQRIGVFMCDCNGEIGGVLDLDEISRNVSSINEVVLAEKIPYGCSPDGEEIIRQRIRSTSLNRVVLLGCSPRMMEKRFQKVCADAGLNTSLLEIVNIRDQCAWVHQDGLDNIDHKAWSLVKLGITRAINLTPIEKIKVEIHPEVAVIGGGTAGMTAALSLADQGVKVTLVEKKADLEGSTRQLNKQVASIEKEIETTRKLVKRIRASQNIDILTRAEVVDVIGSYGNYKIELKMQKGSKNIECGAVILAMGAKELKPNGYYGYSENGKVITQLELEQKLTEKSTVDGLENVIMIQCVGARNDERPYCGRICCMKAVNNAILLKMKKPSLTVTILYRDMPTEPGPDRTTLERAFDLGVNFIRFTEEIPPKVSSSTVIGQSDEGKPFKLLYDLVILSTSLVPHESSQALALAFHLPVDQYGFIPDTLPNLKPHQYTEPCVHVVGSAHWPCSVPEAMYQAYGRSGRIASLIQKREVISSHITATVNIEACRGCSTCLEWCPFSVPVIKPLNGGDPVSSIDPFICKGCGSCVVHCPTGAATMKNLDDEIFHRMIEAALSDKEWNGIKTIAFLCDWSGYAACDLAGTKRKNIPHQVIPIRIPCAGRISTGLILHAFVHGADGVLVCACKEGDCHYLSGNTNCAVVTADTENILSLLGIAKQRLQLEHVSALDIDDFCKTLEHFIEMIEKIEPSVMSPAYNEVEST